MDDFLHLCPVCKAKGNETFLQLRQINLTTAVYICKDLKCPYPTGHEWIFVDKNLFEHDDNDSDISDSVDEDIKRIKLKSELDNVDKENTSKYINNNCNVDKSNNSDILKTDKNKLVETDDNTLSNKKVTESIELEKSKIVTSVDKVVDSKNALLLEDPYDLFATLGLPENEKSLSLPPMFEVGMSDLHEINMNISNKSDINNVKEPVNKDKKPDNGEKEATSETSHSEIIPISITIKSDIIDSNVKCQKMEIICNNTNMEAAQNTVENKNSNKAGTKYSVFRSKTEKNKQIFQNDDKTKISGMLKNNQNVHPAKRTFSEKENKKAMKANMKKINIKNEKSKCKTQYNYLKLGTETDEADDPLDAIYKKPGFESVFQSKLKLQCKKNKPASFSFDESTVKEALETMNMSQNDLKTKQNNSLVKRIMDKKKSGKAHKKSAAYFEGFQFSSKNLTESDEDKEIPPLQNTCTNLKFKNQQTIACQPKEQTTNLEHNQIEAQNMLDTNNSCPTTNNLNIDEISFSELLGNIDNLEAINVPNNSANILDVDEWLNSL